MGGHGNIPLETRDVEQLTRKEDAQRIADEWSDSLYWRQGTCVSAHAMVYSMPAGTDPETGNQAVRETAQRLHSDNHDYLMALQTVHPPTPEHLNVLPAALNGNGFYPRRKHLGMLIAE